MLQSGNLNYLYTENGDATLKISANSTVVLACPGQSIILNSSTIYRNLTSASCVSGSNLNVGGETFAWENIKCNGTLSRIAKLTGNKCENNKTEIEIGFQLTKDSFLRVLLICFDENAQQALYSEVRISSAINRRVQNVQNPRWQPTFNMFNIQYPNSYYNRPVQRQTINNLLGLPADSTMYIKDNSTYFLSRGHMTAKADNFYPAQQQASFFLLNVAPQWQTCNANNWQAAEISVRDYAEAKRVDLLQWTGVYGLATLPHNATGELVQLYLYNQNNTKALPVPELYWKVAYEPMKQKGIVLIVVNNPYLKTYQKICEDISDKVSWIHWDKQNQIKGFAYACTVDSFRKVVSYFPEFTVQGVLV